MPKGKSSDPRKSRYNDFDFYDEEGKGPRRRMDRVKKRPKIERDDDFRPRPVRESRRSRRRNWEDYYDEDDFDLEEDFDLFDDDDEDEEIEVRIPRKRNRS